MPYLESLLAAYQAGLGGQPAISLPEARDALVVAATAEERGRCLAAIACALARERVT